MQVLSEIEWTEARELHERRVSAWTQPHLLRQSHHQRHPTEDFLWDYYSLRPSLLTRWSPGWGVILQGESALHYLNRDGFTRYAEGVGLGAPPLSPRRREGWSWTLSLLEVTASRQPQCACYALHEWAMVYRIPVPRHAQLPLRVSQEQINDTLSRGTLCTHYDAFRFFTSAAAPLNPWQLDRSSQIEHEQPACLHANMDLYKWAYKLLPWIASEVVADAFALALDIRVLDMRASPYDVTHLDLSPIRVETPEGKEQFQQQQRLLAQRAAPLRLHLIQLYRELLQVSTPSLP